MKDNLELNKIKCSVCEVKKDCQECEKDITNTVLEEIRIKLKIGIDEAYDAGLIIREVDIFRVIENIIEKEKVK